MKRKAFILILFLSIMFCVGCSEQMPESETEDYGMTLKQAWEIAEEEALKWSDDAKVTSINSTDYLDTEDSRHGMDGIRNCWSFFFDSDNKGMQFHTYVVNGEIYSSDETTAAMDIAIDMDKIILDSDEVYRQAVEEGISGGTEWAFGYHYMLQYYNSSENDEPILCFVVRGINESGLESMLGMNPYTGTISWIQKKTGYDENGRSIWEITGEFSKTDGENLSEDTDLLLTREEFQKKYDIFSLAKKYHMDPEELTDSFLEGIKSGTFSPFSITESYDQEEWEKRMTEIYGDAWKEW